MSLNMSIRIIIKIFLALQLTLLIVRQMIDFAGIQWLMIMVNAVAIIVTITAFFGYLALYAWFQAILIAYNLFVIGVYARLITLAPGDSITYYSNDDFIGSTDQRIHSLSSDRTFYAHADDFHSPTTTRTSALPSTQLLSFDANSRSFWYVIVSNHMSDLSIRSAAAVAAVSSDSTSGASNSLNGRGSSASLTADESLVDIFVQYIEIFSASIHIFFALCGIGLIALKHKLERDKLFRSNDKTTPPLPPYTISPQMNHYMSYTPTHPFNPSSTTKSNGSSSIYNTAASGSHHNASQNSLRRSKRHRRSTRSLHNSKSKAHSMGALNIRASSGSLRSMTNKQQHRKSATSLLMANGGGAGAGDTSFGNNSNHNNSYNNNTGTNGSRGGSGSRNSRALYQSIPIPSNQNSSAAAAGSRNSTSYVTVPSSSSASYSQQHQQQQQHNYPPPHHAAKFLTSDSETDYYHTFTPNYGVLHNGLHNPLYGNRNSYLNDSETAI